MKQNGARTFFKDDEYIVELKNDERKYFGLEEIKPDYVRSVFFSKTNICYKRTNIFFHGNDIVKVIYEEKKIGGQNTIVYEQYYEYDTYLKTIDRKEILPLTEKGKIKPLTPTNVMAITPFGVAFNTMFYRYNGTSYLGAYNLRNNQSIPIGCYDKIHALNGNDDFREFLKWYINTCPADFFEKVERVKTAKHQTVRFSAGDIFRAEYDRNHYVYGLILGKTREIQKWNEMPKKHSFRSLMTQPIMVRLYDLITENSQMTPMELEKIPLLPMEICSDNDIIWGTYPIVAHKQLVPKDIAFHFICTRIISPDEHKTLFTDDFLLMDLNKKINRKIDDPHYALYIEWGLASTMIPYEKVTPELQEMLKDYSSPYGGVSLGIDIEEAGRSKEKLAQTRIYKNNLLTEENKPILKAIFRCLGINENTTFDEFNNLFGGMTADEFIRKISCHYEAKILTVS